jgi:hypothetical protein
VALKLEGELARREARRIREVSGWPQWPWLAVKRHVDGETAAHFGVITAGDVKAGEMRVFDVTLDALRAADTPTGTTQDPAFAVAAVYASVEAMLDAGWMGD